MNGADAKLPDGLGQHFPDRLTESAIGPIPDGWSVETLEATLDELEVGRRPKGGVSKYKSGIPSIGAESIVRLGVFNYDKVKYVPPEFFDSMTRGHVKNRDVLLYKDGGRPGIFEPHVSLVGEGFPFERCAINEHVYRLRASDSTGQSFLYFWLAGRHATHEMQTKGTGVAVPGLNSTQVKSLRILKPPAEVVRAFNELVEPWVIRILINSRESRTLAMIRDALLPKLISGAVRVPDVGDDDDLGEGLAAQSAGRSA